MSNTEQLNTYLIRTLPQTANSITKILESSVKEAYITGYEDGYRDGTLSVNTRPQITKYKNTTTSEVFCRTTLDVDHFYSCQRSKDAFMLEDGFTFFEYKPISAINNKGTLVNVGQHVFCSSDADVSYNNADGFVVSILPVVGDVVNATVKLSENEYVIANINDLNV